MMKKYYKIMIASLLLLLSITFVPAKAAVGYNYSHDGRLIYSTVGLSVTADGIFTVISDRWTNEAGDKVESEEFKSPSDLYLFTEKNGEDVIYIVDSGSNILYVFDGDVNFKYKLRSFEIRPEDFLNKEEMLSKIKTRQGTGSDAKSISFAEYLRTQKENKRIEDFLEVADKAYEDREEHEKFYINCFELSGVYRSLRPKLDDKGKPVKDEEGYPVMDDLIYLCDKKNNQIVIVDANNYRVVQVVPAPETINFSGKTFLPRKLVADAKGRIYVISEGVYEGIMMFWPDGKFSSFIGVNYVKLSFWQIFWRRLMTEEQIRRQHTIVNTTHTSLAIKNQFIYTTSRAIDDVDDSRMIKRLNAEGKDVLTRNGYHDPKGDLLYARTGVDQNLLGPSRFSAITVNDYGVYTVADEKTGRLFTYDDEGYLLYISGGRGNEFRDLNNPVAICYQGDNIIALDASSKAVLRFVPTDIALVINKAVKYHYEGNLVASSEEWKNVIAKNPNYEYAYIGIGKSLLNEKRYQEAMSYFKTGHDVKYYSKAYKLYRDQVVGKYFTPVFTVGAVLIVALVAYQTYRNIRYKNKDEETGEGDE
jgi:tetratricopeptide (TPR) repeat protein